MQVLKTKSNKLFTEKDYVPDIYLREIEELKLKENFTVYKIEHQDFVAQVPASLKLEDFDKDLLDLGLYSRLWAPARYSISRILSENWGYELYKQILGLELIDINGILTKTGGKVIKNVSGYDLAKIYLGTRNSLAMITHANIKIEKKPEMQVEIKINFELDNVNKIITQESLSKLYEIASSNFDESIEMSIISKKAKEGLFTIELRIRLSARDKLLDLRAKKLLTKLQVFFREIDLEIDFHDCLDFKKIQFAKRYPSDELRLEFHTSLSNLANIYRKLIKAFGEKIIVYPKMSRVDLIVGATNVDDLAIEVNNILAMDGLGPVYLRVFPVSARNVRFEKLINIVDNPFEQGLVTKLKQAYDPRGLLNPGIISGANDYA